jgi:AraC family transcriptional regulator
MEFELSPRVATAHVDLAWPLGAHLLFREIAADTKGRAGTALALHAVTRGHERRLAGRHSTVSERGTIWLRRAGVQEGLIDMSQPMPAILHLYLSPSRFSPDKLSKGLDSTAIRSLRHEGGFHDPLLAEIAYAIMSELEHETSAGGLLAETLALSLMARLVQNHADASSSGVVTPAAREGLEPRRLARVLDFIEANLEGDLTVSRLASVACLSQFHFARAFKAAVDASSVNALLPFGRPAPRCFPPAGIAQLI